MRTPKETAERLVKCAPKEWREEFIGVCDYDLRMELNGRVYTWTFNKPDTYPGNGDYCAWAWTEAAIRDEPLCVEIREGVVYFSHGPDGEKAPFQSLAQALTECLCDILEENNGN